jgi:hypothetical protein
MHERVINEKTAARAREAGLTVIRDKCMLKEHQKLKKQASHLSIRFFFCRSTETVGCLRHYPI